MVYEFCSWIGHDVNLDSIKVVHYNDKLTLFSKPHNFFIASIYYVCWSFHLEDAPQKAKLPHLIDIFFAGNNIKNHKQALRQENIGQM